MFKSKLFAALTITLAATALIATVAVSKVAYAAADDVFMDEGDGDFESTPQPPTIVDQPAEAPAPSKQVEKAPEPRPAAPAEEPEMIPMLTDDQAAPSTPAPTDDSSAPAAASETKEKKSKPAKKKKAKQTASNDEAATPHAASGPHKKIKASGGFVTTKDACPMMRAPASTGEAMLTVKASKKIWVEDAGKDWVKAFNKAGEPGYVSKDCVE